jgi:hypothetical protein
MLPLVQLDAKGLYTFNNLLSQVPPGAMTIANNVIIDRPGIVETRRGFNFYGTQLPSYGIKGYIYLMRLLWYCNGGQLVYDSDAAGTWVQYAGSYFPPTNNFIFSTQSNGNFYFTTNNGVYKIAGLTGTPQQAGGPQALDLNAVTAGAGTAVVTNSQVAYSVVWGYLDANNNLILGAPSEWAYFVNSSGATDNVTLTATIPAGVTTSYFVQVYRTPGTASSSTIPGNNFQLAIVYVPTSTDIANKYVTITDAIPDTLLGAYLYTADGQPMNYPNTPPPLAQDIATFNGMTFYINWQTIQQMTVTMDSVGATLGIQANDTVTLTDVNLGTTYTYTFIAGANNAATRKVNIVTGGTIATNIDGTARNLSAMINQDPNNTLWYAYYQTGTNLLPGGMIISARNLQQGPFNIKSSRTTAWTPALPSAATTYVSSNLVETGHFLVSKVNQPEAVPLVFDNPVQTGNISVILYRALALQDALYIFSNAGIFRVTGTDPLSLQINLFDSSSVLVGLNTPEILNNSIYYCSAQGVCSVSSGGVAISSRNIERDVIQLEVLTDFTSLAFGCSYESDRKYFLFSPTGGSDAIAKQAYVYNWITQCWTLWTRACAAAIVNSSTNKLYVTDANKNVFQERKNIQNSDYSDELYTITINSTSTSANTLTLASSVNVQIGDTIQQTVLGTQYTTQVTGNNSVTGVVNVSSAAGFAAGSAQDYRAIATHLRYTPVTCGFAEYNKRFLIWQFMFENANFTTILLGLSSDYTPTQESQTLAPKTGAGWGTLAWGTFPWGVGTAVEQVIPCWPSTNTALAHWVVIDLSLTQAFTSLSMYGITGVFDIIGARSR